MTDDIPMDPAVQAPPQKGIKYILMGDDRVMRMNYDTGEKTHVASLEMRMLVFENDNALKYRAKVSEALKDLEIEYEGVAVREGNVEPKEATLNPSPVPRSTTIPPPPPKNKRDGDKTKEYVEWLKQWKPEEFESRYGIKGPGSVTKFRKVPHPEIRGRFSREPYSKPALIAVRKTHLTEKADQKDDEGYAAIPEKKQFGGDEE